MVETITKITEEEFYEKYKPVKNHLDDNASWDGCMFETYDEEKQYCFDLAQKENRVWTIIECDDIECDDGPDDEDDYTPPIMYVISGFHWLNRLGFLVTEVPYENDIEVLID